MNLGSPPAKYDPAAEAQMRAGIEAADRLNLKRGTDIEAGKGRVILTDTATGTRYALKVTSGVLGITAV